MTGPTLRDQQLCPTPRTRRRARAFGAGSDARIAGLPLRACPYRDDFLGSAWRLGWWDVHRLWARDALWPHMDLPEVDADG